MPRLSQLASFGFMALAACGVGQTAPSVDGSVESYFINKGHSRGFPNLLWWAEVNAHPRSDLDITGSYILFPGGHSFDEGFVRWDGRGYSVRVGRMRTAFGFNSWADIFYNGFNTLPLVRQIYVVNDLGLTHEDSGAEVTTHLGDTQIQASVIDDNLDRDQLLPDKLDHSTIRAQHSFGSLILGGDFLTSHKGDEKVYGLDARYTMPQVLLRGEAFWGAGYWPGSGYYVDASYRLPKKLYRTQLVARLEGAKPWSAPMGQLTTLGLRQIFNSYFSVNVNYSFGSRIEADPYSHSYTSTGWSTRAMFRYAF